MSSEDSDYDDQAESNSDNGDVDGDTNELPTQAKQGAKGTKAPPPPVRQCTLPADDAPACPPARRSKGKGKELSTPAHDEDTDNACQDPQDSDANNPLVPGRLLAEAVHKAIALGERMFKEAAEIAKEYEKSPGAILIAARLSVKPTRTKNRWNMYQAWYKMKHPKLSDGE